MALPASSAAARGLQGSLVADPVRQTVTAELLQLQEREAYLRNSSLIQLAQRLGRPVSELEAVVSFFPHFRRESPPKCEIHVCRDLACHHRGAAQLVSELEAHYAAQGANGANRDVVVRPVSCLGRCDRAPAALIELPRQPDSDNENPLSLADDAAPSAESPHDAEHVFGFHGRTAAELIAIVEAQLSGRRALEDNDPDSDAAFIPDTFWEWEINPYLPEIGHANGPQPLVPYGALEELKRFFSARNGDFEAAKRDLALFDRMRKANLRGMGGAGIVAAGKWQDVTAQRGKQKYVVCNADESEPLTFKDRELLLRTPYLVIEGMVLAGLYCGATRGYIYVRHEYQEQVAALRRAIQFAEKRNVCGANVGGMGRDFYLDVFVSPGGYICGEQSALIEAMEGHRAQPRGKPPGLETNGLFDKPTLLSNVETFAWVPAVVLGNESPKARRRAEADPAASTKRDETVSWYAALGVRGYQGRRLFSICGDVARPGVYELPIGAPLRELLRAAGGVVDGDESRLVLATSGPSGGFLPARITDPILVQTFQTITAADLKRAEQGPPEAYADLQAFIHSLFPPDADPPYIDVLATPLEIDRFRRDLDHYLDWHAALEILQRAPQELSGELAAAFAADRRSIEQQLAGLPPGVLLGAGIGVFAGERANVLGLARNATEFYSRESCGKCVPCRLGSGRFVELLRRMEEQPLERGELAGLAEFVTGLDETLRETSICGLGTSVPAPLMSLLKFFWRTLPGMPASNGRGTISSTESR